MPKLPTSVTRHTMRLCPHCGYAFNALGTADGSIGSPTEGDCSICLNCAEMLLIDATGAPRAMTEDEKRAAATDPDFDEPRMHQERLRAFQKAGFRTAEAKRKRH
jgi:hypothetical protein